LWRRGILLMNNGDYGQTQADYAVAMTAAEGPVGPSPMLSFSTTATLTPRRASCKAVEQPLMPPPMMITSYVSAIDETPV